MTDSLLQAVVTCRVDKPAALMLQKNVYLEHNVDERTWLHVCETKRLQNCFILHANYNHPLFSPCARDAKMFRKICNKKMFCKLNEVACSRAKFGADLINTSEVTNCKTKWPRF